MVRQILAEVRACRLEVVQQLDSRLLRLILEEGEGKLTQLVAACGLELERQLRAAAPVDPVGRRLDAAVRLQDVLGLGLVVRPLRPVLLVGGVVGHEDRVVQRPQARVQLAEQRLHRGQTIEAQNQSLANPEVLRERVALRALLDVDVLPRRAEVRLDAKTRLPTQLGQCLLRLRVDRVDLATADLLDLRVRVRQELEHDPVELRLRPKPTSRVAGQRDAAAAVERGLEVRTVADRLARLRIDDVVSPDGEQVRTGERVCRQDNATTEEVLPVRERRAEGDLHDLAFPCDALDLVVASLNDVVLQSRAHDCLVPEDEVLARDRDPVAPLCVLADVVRDPHRVELEVELADDVGLVGEVRLDQKGSAQNRCQEHAVPELSTVVAEEHVQTPVWASTLFGSKDERARLLGVLTGRPAYFRRAGSRQRKRQKHRPGKEPELTSMHLLPPFC